MCYNYDVEEILIDCYLTEQPLSTKIGVDLIMQLIYSESDYVRSLVAKALVFENSGRMAVEFLCILADDVDAGVRVEAVDSLSAFPCKKSYEKLCSLICDSDELVRAYAAFGIAVVGHAVAHENALNLLSQIEKNETNGHALVGIYEGLYILGSTDALNMLIEQFVSGDYQIQCSVLHALMEILNSTNCAIIQTFVEALDLASYPFSVVHLAEQLKTNCTASKHGATEK